ncbi:MAG: ATP-binding protein [Clostridia bacterium]|jgi:DNA replication protein DnaC|nr:ATP-binding protein [Clostridia bacterium]
MSKSYFDLQDESDENLQFLYDCLHKELILREQKSRATKIGKAHLPSFKTLEEYDLNFQPQLSKWQIEELKKLNWLKENIIFMGSSGTGKTHLAVAIGHLALSQNYKVFFSTLENLIYLLKTKEVFKSSGARVKYLYECHLVIIDEVGYQRLEKQDVLLMYELVNKLYNKTSIIFTTNLNFAKWGELFQDESMVNAILDRLTHNCQIINLKGESYRLLNHNNIFKKKN